MYDAGLFRRIAAVGWLTVLAAAATGDAQEINDSAPSGRSPRRAKPKTAGYELRMNPATRPEAWTAANTVRWDAIDVAPLLAEDAARAGRPVPLRIGVNREAPGRVISPAKDGSWMAQPDGSAVWTLRVDSSGAKGLRIHFSQFDLDDDAGVRVRGDDGDADLYSGRGPNRDGSFWTAPTPGEIAYLEYFNASGKRDPRLEIDAISHFYRDAGFNPPVAQPNAPGDGGVAGLLPCQEDVMCHEVDATARDSVGRMIFSVPGQGTFLCSGALINDVDPNTYAGYFLTANHCISDQATASTLTVYWFYQSLSCGGAVPSLSTRPRSLGAKLLATSSLSDFSFLRLNNDPDDGQGFAAWTTTVPAANGAAVKGIHHPGGSYKRYSEGVTTTAQPICGGLPTSRFVYNDWTLGVTEGGSSGSPLFNANWEVVGQLYGVCYVNTPACNNPQDYNNLYGRFSVSYASISSYLNAIIPDDAYEDNDTMAQAPVITAGTYALRLVDFDDYFKVVFVRDMDVTVSASFDPADMDLNLYLRDSVGAIVASSAGFTGVESIVASVPAGTYYIHANKYSGWGGNYTLDFRAFGSGCTPPSSALPEPGGFTKNRFISFQPSADSLSTAVRVKLVSLQHPDPPNYPGSPPPDFSAFEGQARWVGPPADYVETTNPATTFKGAALQCQPYYTDWSTVGLVHVYGAEIVPSSEYEVASVIENCDPAVESNYSPGLMIATGIWGDVAEPLQAPSPAPRTQPDISDVSAIVDKFKAAPGAAIVARAMLQPNAADPTAAISFTDISACVDAFKGLPYPFAGPSPCP